MKHVYFKIYLISFILFFVTCTSRNNPSESLGNLEQYILDEGSPNNKLVVYQIFTRLFGNKNTNNTFNRDIDVNGTGKFVDIDETALKELKAMGITHVWYTGIIEHATMTDYSSFGIKRDNPEVVKGKAGSPYAIKDYYDVNPDLAVNVKERMKEFEALVKRTHDQGMKVIIDFVPNHVARQYKSDAKPKNIKDLGEKDDTSKAFAVNNNFYYLPGESFIIPEGYDPYGMGEANTSAKQTFKETPAKASGNDVFKAQPSVHDWFETIKFNYGVDPATGEKHFDPIPDTWIKMEQILHFWAEKGVDGFRCDMAEMVPVEFWQWVIPRVKSANLDILFIAEIYNPAQYENYLNTGKFDFLYDKVQLYDTLKHIIQDKGSTDYISTVTNDLRGLNKYMLRFLENHDEQRIASPDFAGDPFKAIPAMVVSAMLYTGPIMVYFGQEVGEPGAGVAGFSGEDGRSTIFDYWGVPEHQKWMNNGKFDGGQLDDDRKRLRGIYAEILNVAKDNEAISQGKFFDLHTLNRRHNKKYDEKLYSFLRYTDNQSFLVATNFSDSQVNAKIAIPLEVLKFQDLQKISGGADGISKVNDKQIVHIKADIKPWDYVIVELK